MSDGGATPATAGAPDENLQLYGGASPTALKVHFASHRHNKVTCDQVECASPSKAEPPLSMPVPPTAYDGAAFAGLYAPTSHGASPGACHDGIDLLCTF